MASPAWRIKPIFVVGINRSGTKWLSNEIAANPEVAAIQAVEHGGILESNMLTRFGRERNCASGKEYAELIEFWSGTHFFELARGQAAEFLALDPRPADSVEAFRYLMERVAVREGKRFWLQKMAPVDALSVLDRVPDARVVVIRRSPVESVRSKIGLDARRGMHLGAFRAGMSQGIQQRQLERVRRRSGVLTVTYEDLVDDRQGTMETVFQHLGLAPTSERSPYRPNTSFRASSDRNKTLSPAKVFQIRLALFFCRLLPISLLEVLQARFTRGRPAFIPGTFAHRESPSDIS
jgi:hypothetical protein